MGDLQWFQLKPRGGWTRYKRYLNILLFNCILFFVFHVTLNSCNTKLKNDGVHWGLLNIQIDLHIGFKAMYFVFSKHLRFGVKLINCDLMHSYNFTRLVVVSCNETKTLHCITLRSLYYPTQ